MPIVVSSVEGLYHVEVTPPHGGGRPWRSEPLELRALIDALVERGCHPTDIGDALFAVDPGWESRL